MGIKNGDMSEQAPVWLQNLRGGVRELVNRHGNRASRHHLLAALDEAERQLAIRDELVAALKRIEATYTCVCRHGRKCCNTIPNVYCPRCIAHAAIASAGVNPERARSDE